MPYPNKTQWIIIWLAVVIAAHIWLGLKVSDLWPGNEQAAWGLPAYIERAFVYPNGPAKPALTVLVIGGLLVWMASRKRKQ
jgi:hypothetical protein